MGNPKQKWTSEEEEALRAGIAKHGAGKWKNIQRDPEFNHLLFARSNIDLKDKWRNLSVANGQGSRDKSKTPKGNPGTSDACAVTPLPLALAPASATPLPQDASADVATLDASKPLPEGNNNAAKYNALIFEALSTLKEPNGLDASAIAYFIEQRQEVPPNFKRHLNNRLRRLVQQDKLEKVENCYKMKIDTLPDAKNIPAPPRQKDLIMMPRQNLSNIAFCNESVEEAAIAAAYQVAEAENKSFVASEAAKESERVAFMAEEMEALLQFAQELYDKTADGDVVLLG